MQKRFGVLCAVACAASGMLMTAGLAPAASISFKAITGDWNVPANWSSGNLPTSTDTAGAPNGANATIDSNVGTVLDVRWANSGSAVASLTVFSGGSITTATGGLGFTLGRSNNSNATMTMSGGSVTTLAGTTGDGSGIFSVGDLVNSNGFATATFNLSGGTVTIGNNYYVGTSNNSSTAPTVFSIGVVNQTGGDITAAGAVDVGLSGNGTYNMSAGTLSQTGTNPVGSSLGHDAFFVARNRGATGSFTQSGMAAVTISGGLYIGTGNANNGSYIVSGGTLNLSGPMFVGSSVNDGNQTITGNTGLFSIVGNSAPTITANELMADTAGSTLNFSIGSDTGATLLNLVAGTVETASYPGNAIFSSATNIDVDNIGGYLPAMGQSYTLLTAAGGINTLPTLVNDGDAFDNATLSIVSNPDGSSSLVVTTFVPEPGSIGLLALAGLAGLRRRK